MRAADHPYFAGPFAALAHRGGSLLAANLGRENTLAAFRAATSLGYTQLETDVHLTADGSLVAFHDATLDRVSDAGGPIALATDAQVRAARVQGEPIPWLDEVFESFPTARINIDLKADGTEAALVAVLDRHHAWQRVCVGSFSQARLQRFRRLAAGRAATACGPQEVMAQAVAGLIGAPVSSTGLVYQVPTHTRVLGRPVPLVTGGFVRGAHRAGRAVHVWTIDDPDEMHRLIDLGVDGLVSDAIDTLKRVLIARGLWHQP